MAEPLITYIVNMRMLRDFIRSVLTESTFEEWLSPEIMQLLIGRYAMKNDHGMKLAWQYNDIGSAWGYYNPNTMLLTVSKTKTRGQLKEQVATILHEIEHFNQHVMMLDDVKGPVTHEMSLVVWKKRYKKADGNGYSNNPYEISAEHFAQSHVQEALKAISDQYSNTVEDSDIDAVLEELMDDIDSTGTITRFQIGSALKVHGMNTPQNMIIASEKLKDLGAKIK